MAPILTDTREQACSIACRRSPHPRTGSDARSQSVSLIALSDTPKSAVRSVADRRKQQQRVGGVGAGFDDPIDCAGPCALRVHAPAGVVPPQPSEHLQHCRVSGDVSAGSGLKTRDPAGARRLGRYLIVLELHAGPVIGFETLRHAGQRVTLRRSLPPADYCVEAEAALAPPAECGSAARGPLAVSGTAQMHGTRLSPRDCCFPRMQEHGGAELRAGGCLGLVRCERLGRARRDARNAKRKRGQRTSWAAQTHGKVWNAIGGAWYGRAG